MKGSTVGVPSKAKSDKNCYIYAGGKKYVVSSQDLIDFVIKNKTLIQNHTGNVEVKIRNKSVFLSTLDNAQNTKVVGGLGFASPSTRKSFNDSLSQKQEVVKSSKIELLIASDHPNKKELVKKLLSEIAADDISRKDKKLISTLQKQIDASIQDDEKRLIQLKKQITALRSTQPDSSDIKNFLAEVTQIKAQSLKYIDVQKILNGNHILRAGNVHRVGNGHILNYLAGDTTYLGFISEAEDIKKKNEKLKATDFDTRLSDNNYPAFLSYDQESEDKLLETRHNYVQILFPNSSPSTQQPNVTQPVIGDIKSLMEDFRKLPEETRKKIHYNIELAAKAMISFFEKGGKTLPSHNLSRISRIIECLVMFECPNRRDLIENLFNNLKQNNLAVASAISHWQKQINKDKEGKEGKEGEKSLKGFDVKECFYGKSKEVVQIHGIDVQIRVDGVLANDTAAVDKKDQNINFVVVDPAGAAFQGGKGKLSGGGLSGSLYKEVTSQRPKSKAGDIFVGAQCKIGDDVRSLSAGSAVWNEFAGFEENRTKCAGVIHAVGPNFTNMGDNQNEFKKSLAEAIKNAILVYHHNTKEMADEVKPGLDIPLISGGIYRGNLTNDQYNQLFSDALKQGIIDASLEVNKNNENLNFGEHGLRVSCNNKSAFNDVVGKIDPSKKINEVDEVLFAMPELTPDLKSKSMQKKSSISSGKPNKTKDKAGPSVFFLGGNGDNDDEPSTSPRDPQSVGNKSGENVR